MAPVVKKDDKDQLNKGVVFGVGCVLTACAYAAWRLTKAPYLSSAGMHGGHLPLGYLETRLQSTIPESGDAFEDALLHLELARHEEAPPRRVSGAPKKEPVKKTTRSKVGSAERTERRKAMATDAEEQEQAKQIIADFVNKLVPQKAGDARDTVDSTLEKMKAEKDQPKRKVGRTAKSSDADIKKARGIISDALQKLGSSSTGDDKEDMRILTELLESKTSGDGEKTSGTKGPIDDVMNSHYEFLDLLQKEREQQSAYGIVDVKKEFKEEFGADAKRLMCSGCKLVARRLETELDTHDVHEQQNPAALLTAKRRALDAACTSFRHLEIIDDGNLRYQAKAATESRDEANKPTIAQRLCLALLEDARFDMLSQMIQHKMTPEKTNAKKSNWEGWLCARRTRLCKRSEVRDADEEDGEL